MNFLKLSTRSCFRHKVTFRFALHQFAVMTRTFAFSTFDFNEILLHRKICKPGPVPNRCTTSEPGYNNFGHKRRKMSFREYMIYGVVCMIAITCFYSGIDEQEMDETGRREAQAASLDDNEEAEDGKADDKKRPKMTFRDKKIIAYENKIRAFSTPEKVFRYFSTLKIYPPTTSPHPTHFEVFMTPDDFFRSLTPGIKQPEGFGLEQFKQFNPQHDVLPKTWDEISVFFKLGKHGLISYTDYIFLLTLLSTSARHFSLAFKMFDINGDGHLDYNEFETVENVIRHQTTVGAQHRDHASSGTVLRHHTNSSLAAYFFGPNREQKLTIEKFLEFQEQLQRDILKMEFERHNPTKDCISEVSFGKMLLQHSGLDEKKQQKKLKRVKNYYKKMNAKDEAKSDESVTKEKNGLTLAEVNNFFRFLTNISDVDTALTFYRMSGAPVDRATLQHVAKTVAHVQISDHVIETVFVLFDENRNGELSNREFVSIMKKRLNRGLERRKDTGFLRTMSAMWRCGVDMLPVSTLHRT